MPWNGRSSGPGGDDPTPGCGGRWRSCTPPSRRPFPSKSWRESRESPSFISPAASGRRPAWRRINTRSSYGSRLGGACWRRVRASDWPRKALASRTRPTLPAPSAAGSGSPPANGGLDPDAHRTPCTRQRRGPAPTAHRPLPNALEPLSCLSGSASVTGGCPVGPLASKEGSASGPRLGSPRRTEAQTGMPGAGKDLQSSATSAATFSMSLSSPTLVTTWSIQWARRTISSLPMPREVIEGVPMR